MSETAAKNVIEGYTEAWTRGDLAKARTYLADDLKFEGSIFSFSIADDLIAALKGFPDILERIDVHRRLFDDRGGVLLYDCVTTGPVGVIRHAEFFEVEDGKITEIRLVFDATELRKFLGD